MITRDDMHDDDYEASEREWDERSDEADDDIDAALIEIAERKIQNLGEQHEFV